jgi:uncharacterized membrane protein YphA (DoxX/SURF4 family)
MKKDTCDTSCCANNALGLGLVRIGVGLLFLVMGLSKLMMPEMVQGMLQNLLGVEAQASVIWYWILVIAEVGGGIVILLGKIVPKNLYYAALAASAVVMIVALITAVIPAVMDGTYPMAKRDLMLHISTLLTIIGLMWMKPMCILGITGDKE